MDRDEISSGAEATVRVKPCDWPDWAAMWQLRAYQLAEDGVALDGQVQGLPDLTQPYDEANPNYPAMECVPILQRRGLLGMLPGDLAKTPPLEIRVAPPPCATTR